MNLIEAKKALRSEVRAAECALSPRYRAESNAGINARLLALPEFRMAQTVFAFVGTAREIDTMALLRRILDEGKTLVLPRCGAEHTMALCRVETLEQLAPGAYGILEPVESCGVLTPEEIELTITPCLSCDRQGNRLGQGGGYYDRFFARYHGAAALLCREKLMAEAVPVEAHDRRFDLLVTENAVYRL